MRVVLLAVSVLLSGCAAVPAPTPVPWFIGHFTASYADAKGASDFSITCSAKPDCETTIAETMPLQSAPQKILSKNAPRVNVDILNNNLQAVRSAVAARPKLYDDVNDGALLRRLRPVIESTGKFTECFGVAPDGGDSIALCQHTDGKQQVPVLLFSTMKGACADSAFCAYYLLPLARRQ